MHVLDYILRWDTDGKINHSVSRRSIGVRDRQASP